MGQDCIWTEGGCALQVVLWLVLLVLFDVVVIVIRFTQRQPAASIGRRVLSRLSANPFTYILRESNVFVGLPTSLWLAVPVRTASTVITKYGALRSLTVNTINLRDNPKKGCSIYAHHIISVNRFAHRLGHFGSGMICLERNGTIEYRG